MIPILLNINGFLSYQKPAELDFSGIDLACISGSNGAGKSSLLDAITWVLFGIARKRDDSLVNNHPDVKAAEVRLTFLYENTVYRVQRTLPRGKTTQLEFHICRLVNGSVESSLPSPLNAASLKDATWKPLTERTLRETQSRIEETLRMDYDTFINASFFLQGKSDQFTTQRPSDRKKILGSILGLETWEIYKQRAVEFRRGLETEVNNLDGQLQEINKELDEAPARIARLEELQKNLESAQKSRLIQETLVQNYRELAARLQEQRRLVETLLRQSQSAHAELDRLIALQAEREKEKIAYAELVANQEKIEADYSSWQSARHELEKQDQIAEQFHQSESKRREPLEQLNNERGRLQQSRLDLQNRQAQAVAAVEELNRLQGVLASMEIEQAEAQRALEARPALLDEIEITRQRQAELNAANTQLMNQMKELRSRVDRLENFAGEECPFCGQPLTSQDSIRLADTLASQGKQLADEYRDNKILLESIGIKIIALQKQIEDLKTVENKYHEAGKEHARLQARLHQHHQAVEEWETSGSLRLQETIAYLENENFLPEVRVHLAQIDAELQATGYDPAAHDKARQQENGLRTSESQYQSLLQAQAALAPLERELAEMARQIEKQTADTQLQDEDHRKAAAELEAAELKSPDLTAAETEWLNLQEKENRMRLDVGGAHQKVAVLDDLRKRSTGLTEEREDKARLIGRYRQLERAFGRDGVPALLIEQALPQIEARANETLQRLSGSMMSLRFITQAEFKDARRDDRRETLDIQISDGTGARDYEMYSGGEAFKVNFAIRLALSELLAQRAGARLQTLVIDEGFGSQDAQGRQRLIEAINLVRQHFAKILVITHIDELKDAFPNRIEVEKSDQGSILKVL